MTNFVFSDETIEFAFGVQTKKIKDLIEVWMKRKKDRILDGISFNEALNWANSIVKDDKKNIPKTINIGEKPISFSNYVKEEEKRNEKLKIVKYKELLNKFFGPRHSSLRIGQHCFNILYEEHKDIAEKVRGTHADPFYKDEVIHDFLAFVYLFIEY